MDSFVNNNKISKNNKNPKIRPKTQLKRRQRTKIKPRSQLFTQQICIRPLAILGYEEFNKTWAWVYPVDYITKCWSRYYAISWLDNLHIDKFATKIILFKEISEFTTKIFIFIQIFQTYYSDKRTYWEKWWFDKINKKSIHPIFQLLKNWKLPRNLILNFDQLWRPNGIFAW